jgi:hypothetical protein
MLRQYAILTRKPWRIPLPSRQRFKYTTWCVDFLNNSTNVDDADRSLTAVQYQQSMHYAYGYDPVDLGPRTWLSFP